MAASQDADVSSAATRASGLFVAARRIVQEPTGELTRRCLAAALLGRGIDHRDEDRELLLSLLSPQYPVELQAAAVAALVAGADDGLPAELLSQWKSTEPATHAVIVNALLSREGWSRALLDAVAEQSIHPGELDASSRARLVDHSDAEIKQRATELFRPAATRNDVLVQFESTRSLKGDPSKGAEVFKKTCAVCHKLHDQGNDIGARLAALQDKSTDNLMLSILDPNRGVEGKFLNYAAATRDGRTWSGMIVEETSTSITLARADGKRDVLLRIDIEALASTGKSFMPEGLEKELTPQSLADVIAFIQAERVP
jgi:putative heme-binding domain-containing protein